MSRESTSQFWPTATQCFFGSIGVAVVTFVCFRLELNVDTAGFAYLILIALLSLIGSFIGSVVLSVVAAACLTYFFAPPLLTLRVADPRDVVAIAAFLTSSIVITGLIAKMRKMAEEARSFIADRRRANEALRDSEEQWREVFEHNPVMYFMVDAGGTVLSVNAFGAAQLGYSVGELVGQSVLNVFFEEDREFVRKNVAVCTERPGRSHGWEVRKIRKDGTVLWVRENAKAVRRPGNQLIVLVACEDVTERKRAEDALRQSEMYLAEAQRISHTGSFAWRVARGELFWSDEIFRIFEYDRATKPTLELVLQRTHPEDRAAVQRLLDRVSDEGADWELDRRLLMPDGSVKYVHAVAHVVNDAADNLEFVGAVMDVTATKRAEEQLNLARAELAHVTRVTTMGELTATIAHEVSQPLRLVRPGRRSAHLEGIESREEHVACKRLQLALLGDEDSHGGVIAQLGSCHQRRAALDRHLVQRPGTTCTLVGVVRLGGEGEAELTGDQTPEAARR